MSWILPGVEVIPPPAHVLARRARDRAYKARNPERRREQWTRQNRKRKAYYAAWIEANRERVRMAGMLRQRRYRARKRAAS